MSYDTLDSPLFKAFQKSGQKLQFGLFWGFWMREEARFEGSQAGNGNLVATPNIGA